VRSWLAQRALRITTIELSQGAWPLQTMITTWLSGRQEDAIRSARGIRAGLAPLGVEVKRIKLEIAYEPGTPAVPGLYLEHHVKVRTPVTGLAKLAALGRAHDAHLSRSPRRLVDEDEERFLTQRFPPDATRAAETGLGALLAALGLASVTVLKVEREIVIHDDNLLLDAGWRPEVSP
jgi:hypothetical protein